MFHNYCHFGVLLLLVTLSVVTVECVTVTTKVPEVFEAGKPATIECDIVYSDLQRIKLTTLYYMDTNGKPITIGDNINGFKINPVKDRANISITVNKVKIVFNKLRYNDKFVFVCEGSGAAKDFSNRNKKNATITIQNVKGGVKNCGIEISKPYYALEEGTNSFGLTLCGNPQPELFYTFQGKTKEAAMIEKVDDSKKMYKYKIKFENIDRKVCGSTLEFKATGFKDWQASPIIQVNYTPDAVNPNQFQVIKESSRIENCTIFKMPPQANRKCQHTHNIFTYDASNNDIQQFLNKSSIEVKICNDPNLFRKIEFAKVVAVWMTKTSDQMTDFVRVTSKNKIVNNSGDEGSESTTIVIIVVVIVVLIFIVLGAICYICWKRNQSMCKKQSDLYEPRSTENDNETTENDTTDNRTYEKLRSDKQVYENFPNQGNHGNNNKSIYSELGEGGGRDTFDEEKKPVTRSNYADVRDLESDEEREYPPHVKTKDIFDPIESDDGGEILPSLNKVKVFSAPSMCNAAGGNEGPPVKRGNKRSTQPVNEFMEDGKYPDNYIRNEGLPVYEDPMESMRNNPPTWEYYDRQQIPGGEKLPPIAYPKFNREKTNVMV